MNPQQMMKQMKKLQSDMMEAQKELESQKVEASAGGGAVKVIATGGQEIVEIKIDPAILEDGEIELLEEMVTIAVNDALNKAKELAAGKMGGLTGGMSIPGLF